MVKKDKKKKSKSSIPTVDYPYKPSKALINELETFLDLVPPRRLSRHLRNFFLEFFPHYVNHSVPLDLETTTTDFYFLLEFLDKAGEEMLEFDRRNDERDK